MAREILTDEQVKMEVEALKDSPFVRLAEKEIRLKARQRKWLYQLRWLEKRGKELVKQGISLENIEEKMFSELPAEVEEG